MKVWPKSDEVRKVLYHPTGAHFPEEGPVEWPDDTYTARRIADGDVSAEDPGAGGTTRKKSETK